MIGHHLHVIAAEGRHRSSVQLDGETILVTDLLVNWTSVIREATLTFYISSYTIDGEEQAVAPLRNHSNSLKVETPSKDNPMGGYWLNGKRFSVLMRRETKHKPWKPAITHVYPPGKEKGRPDKVSVTFYAAKFTAESIARERS